MRVEEHIKVISLQFDSSCKFNCLVSMDVNGNLKISKLPLKQLNENLKTIIANAKRDEDIKDKLLE